MGVKVFDEEGSGSRKTELRNRGIGVMADAQPFTFITANKPGNYRLFSNQP